MRTRVVILGGGTAGWLTAAILNKKLPHLAITLVESSVVAPIGVGEATIPTLTKTLRDLEVDEGEFLAATNATFKHAILFRDWLEPPGAERSDYYHSFEKYQALDTLRMPWLASAARLFTGSPNPDLTGAWLSRASSPAARPYAYETGIQATLCDRGLAPKRGDEGDYNGLVPYAYHFDADRFGAFLADLCGKRGVKRVLAHVQRANRAANGDIVSLVTDQGEHISGDLFIDCTGFRAELIGGQLETPFVSYSGHLLCDRAVAARVPHEEGRGLRPYTTATAVASGWIWDLDVRTRRGAGYVYSSHFAGDEEARLVLHDYLGRPEADFEPRIVKFDPGRRALMWKNNVVAIGLSGGFLEPLESTGIYLVEMAASLLASYGGAWGEDATRSTFNAKLVSLYDEIRDFIVLHYYLTKRSDTPFWREVRQPSRCPPSLSCRLEQWATRAPAVFDTTDTWQCFWYNSYRSVLYGMHHLPELSGSPGGDERTSTACAELMSWAADYASDRLPSHEEGIAATIENGTRLRAFAAPDPAVRDIVVDLERPTGALWVAAGTIRSPQHPDRGPEYEASALVPLGDWRAAEMPDLARAAEREAPLGRRVALVTVPSPVVEALRSVASIPDEAGSSSVEIAKERRRIFGLALGEIVRLYGDARVPSRILGFGRNPAGLVTTTTGRDGRRIGLHVDSWSNAPWSDRGTVDNRLCLNVGSSPRRLLFVPVTLEYMARSLAVRGIDVAATSPTDLGRLYLKSHPDTPVFALSVAPGEAYIAPTENMVHDGSTLDTAEDDVFITFLGRFTKREEAPPPGRSPLASAARPR